MRGQVLRLQDPSSVEAVSLTSLATRAFSPRGTPATLSTAILADSPARWRLLLVQQSSQGMPVSWA